MIHAMICAGRLERVIYMRTEPQAIPLLKQIEFAFGDNTSRVVNIDVAGKIPELNRNEKIISAYFAGAPHWYDGNVNHHCIKYHMNTLKKNI